MKPQDLLKFRLEATFVPFMEDQGFRYSQSQIKFTRNLESFVQTVSITLSRYNFEDNCNFSTYWNVHSPAYSKWYRGEWGENPASNILGGGIELNIPGWDRAGGVLGCNLTNTQGDLGEIERLLRNASQSGLPYLRRLSSWQGAAEDLLSRLWKYAQAADFLLIAGEKERAREALILGLRSYEVEGRKDAMGDLPQIKKRLDRYF